MEINRHLERIRKQLGKYEYAGLILVIGIILMCLPWGSKAESNNIQQQVSEAITISMEDQLEKILSQLQGAGKVQVMLSIADGEKTIYQYDEDASLRDTESTVRKDTVIITDGNRNQKPVISQVIPAKYLGAVIICQGADQPTVRLAIVEAVSKLTGLGTDRVCVLKMK